MPPLLHSEEARKLPSSQYRLLSRELACNHLRLSSNLHQSRGRTKRLLTNRTTPRPGEPSLTIIAIRQPDLGHQLGDREIRAIGRTSNRDHLERDPFLHGVRRGDQTLMACQRESPVRLQQSIQVTTDSHTSDSQDLPSFCMLGCAPLAAKSGRGPMSRQPIVARL